MRNGRFPSKTVRHLKKVLTISLCEYCQRQSCKAFTGLSINTKKRRFPISIHS